MSEIPTYCSFGQLSRIEYVFQMLGDGASAFVEKNADQLPRQPNGFLRHANLDTLLPVLPGENQKLGGGVADLEFLVLAHERNGHNGLECFFFRPASAKQR